MSGGNRFRGASALKSEVGTSAEFDAVTDEIRMWSILSETKFQRFASVEDGVLNDCVILLKLKN
jgi:hypothetical protein